jgi:predicted thioesterase
MKAPFQSPLKHKFSFEVPENKTVPHLYPEATSFKTMPEVFATGVKGPKMRFGINGRDRVERIGGGDQMRFVIEWNKFNSRVANKVKRPQILAGAA